MYGADHLPGLGGATMMVMLPPQAMRRATSQLLTCHSHHFAVIGEGGTIACSPLGIQCLTDAGILDPRTGAQAIGGRE